MRTVDNSGPEKGLVVRGRERLAHLQGGVIRLGVTSSRFFAERMTSDRKLKASREGSK